MVADANITLDLLSEARNPLRLGADESLSIGSDEV